jgi:hypothetical protein
LDVFYAVATLDMSNTWNLGSLCATIQGEQRMSYMQEAVREWVWTVGQDRSDQQWVLSAYDTWERNPHYTGPDQGHPEDNCEDEE